LAQAVGRRRFLGPKDDRQQGYGQGCGKDVKSAKSHGFPPETNYTYGHQA
jgi:hypothetical protein